MTLCETEEVKCVCGGESDCMDSECECVLFSLSESEMVVMMILLTAASPFVTK